MLAAVGRLRDLWWLARTLTASGLLAPLRPDKYLRMAAVIRRHGTTPMTGISLSAVRRPHATALVDERGALTYAELEARSDALALGLADVAVGPVDAIAVLCRNHRGFVEALSAAARIGADAVLLNTGFSGPQLADVLAREKATVLVYDEEFSSIVEQTRSRVDGPVEILAWTDRPTDAPTVDALIDAHLGERAPRPRRHGKTILLTSGTTGTPKGARRSGGGGAGALAAMFDRIPWRAEETVVVAAPMFHAWGFGQLAVAVTMTSTVVMRRRFDPEAIVDLVDAHHATGLAVVPVMLERIVALPQEVLSRHSLRSLRFVTASGSRMRADAVTRFMDLFGDVVYNSYNATEAGLISIATPWDLRAAPDSAGRPVAGTDLRIVDDQMREVPHGDVGKILVLSDSQFEGYTSGDAKHFDGGYMVSGDLGRLDDHGRLHVVGRDDEMIVSGGENVYPTEVEETLNAHPAVLEAAVVGVDDESFGQRLAAFVVLHPGRQSTAEEMKQHVKDQLAGYKVPRDVTFRDDLPR
ncbi:MAG: AMP-binding protein, partial [Actinomycetota bacterium]|nr:AMP-binding protein [Actinomycetota bacterium]